MAWSAGVCLQTFKFIIAWRSGATNVGRRLSVLLRSFLNGYIWKPAPLKPRVHILSHIPITEQILQNEPGMARPPAHSAVSANLLVRSDSFPLIHGSQLFNGLEHTVVVHCRLKWNVNCSGDMPGALTLLRRFGRPEEFASIFFGVADINQYA